MSLASIVADRGISDVAPPLAATSSSMTHLRMTDIDSQGPYTGSFPLLNRENVSYFSVPGENHSSIVSRVSTIQVQRCIDWMQKYTQDNSSFGSTG